jgi:hypothetical protein
MIAASTGRPSRPPARFSFSIIMTMICCNGRSLVVSVPESECRMPTLIEP